MGVPCAPGAACPPTIELNGATLADKAATG